MRPHHKAAVLALAVLALLVGAPTHAAPPEAPSAQPTDPELARRALAELARGHEAVGRYADAADFAEQYAARYPDDMQTPDLLRDAYRIRVGLGQRDQALAVLDRLEARYLRRDPEQAAQIFWRRRDLLRGDHEHREHAIAYLKRHGKSGPQDLLIVASARVGQLQWQAACEKGPLHDLCISIQRPGGKTSDEGPRDRARMLRDRTRHHQRPRPPEPPTCKQATTPTLTVYPRNPKLAAEARRWLTEALELARRAPVAIPADDVPRARAYHDATAMAALHLADAKLEELLALPVPSGLRFASEPADRKQQRVREDSLRRLSKYLADTGALAQTLERQYAEIAASRTSPEATIAALTRLGQLAEYRAAALLLAELPAEIDAPPIVAAYCEAMLTQVQPLLAAAVAAHGRCLETSITTGHFTDFSRLSEQTLQTLDRRGWPELVEIFGTAQYTESRPETIGVVETPPHLSAVASDAASRE
ncbi:hypothetical protein [Nannocystis sp.]|uniref:tetratricopeptide repeat protein n=1 Tax=Nannocystis sp. TaxID=1962667 RepID=UPI0025FC8455|nr:hypothetical protein [Nannocystis sp.]MBK7825314.1 hypothetical protein [Nannocystis sp.]